MPGQTAPDPVNRNVKCSGTLRFMVLELSPGDSSPQRGGIPLSHWLPSKWQESERCVESVFCHSSWPQTPMDAMRIGSQAVKRGGCHSFNNTRKRKTDPQKPGEQNVKRTWNVLGFSHIYKLWTSWNSSEIFCGPTLQWNASLSLEKCEELAANLGWLVLSFSLGSPRSLHLQSPPIPSWDSSHGEVCHWRHHTQLSFGFQSKVLKSVLL